MKNNSSTHFGYTEISAENKAKKISNIFHSVADRYNLINDLMSIGIHRLWKLFTIHTSGVNRGAKVLDIAGGTGDLALKLSKIVGNTGLVILADINSSMLTLGRNRLINQGLTGNINYVQANAEHLPFPNNSFDCITISFGLRNVTDKNAALRSMHNNLKPGGQLLILEFSQTADWFAPIYDIYSFGLLPKIGKIFSGNEESYQYLAESIRIHPNQESLKQMMEEVGFEHCRYNNMTAGIVALHSGYKF